MRKMDLEQRVSQLEKENADLKRQLGERPNIKPFKIKLGLSSEELLEVTNEAIRKAYLRI